LPPSSQPRPEGSDEEEEEIQYGDEDDDHFEGFDIDPSQKEFMNELLAIAPEEEVELLSPPPSKKHKHKHSDKSIETATSKKTTASHSKQPEIKEFVQDFASSHPIYDKRKWAEEDVEEYQHDIYQFATAAGLGPHQARVQVMLAVGLWKMSKGLPVIRGEFSKEDERKMEDTLSAIGIAKELLAGGKKRKRDDDETASEVNTPNLASVKLAGVSGENLAKEEKRALRKAAKKARRREQMKLKKMGLKRRGSDASSSQSAQPGPVQPPKVTLQSSQSYYAQEASPPLPISTTGAESKKERKKRAKPGPTTSPHFSQSQPSPPMPKNNAQKALARLPKSIQEKLELAKLAVSDAVEVVEKTVEENKKRKAEVGEVEQGGSKKKRKKNRNKNRLGVDEREPKSKIEIEGHGEEAKKKKRRDRGRKSSTQQGSGEVEATTESAAEPMELDAVEYPSTEAADLIPESIKANILAAQKKARRREKKAKKREGDSTVQQADGEPIEASNTGLLTKLLDTNSQKNASQPTPEDTAVAPAEPLAELPDTNSKKPKDKKKKKKRKHAAENADVEANGQGSSENLLKARHS
jgi:hypothetical protein